MYQVEAMNGSGRWELVAKADSMAEALRITAYHGGMLPDGKIDPQFRIRQNLSKMLRFGN